MTFMRMLCSLMIQLRQISQENQDAWHQKLELSQGSKVLILNRTQDHNTLQKKSQFTRILKNIPLVQEEVKLLKIKLQRPIVLDLADTSQKLVPTHLKRKTSQDGLFQKLEELPMKEGDQIEIKPTIQDQHLEVKLIQRIELVRKLILVQAIVLKLTNLALSKIKCKEGLA